MEEARIANTSCLSEIIPVFVGVGHGEGKAAPDVGAVELIHQGEEFLDGALRAGGHRHDEPAGPLGLEECQRGPHGVARGQAVIHHQGRLAVQAGIGPAAPEAFLPLPAWPPRSFPPGPSISSGDRGMRRSKSSLKMACPPGSRAPKPASVVQGSWILRTMMRSRGSARARAISVATGTPPAGMANRCTSLSR